MASFMHLGVGGRATERLTISISIFTLALYPFLSLSLALELLFSFAMALRASFILLSCYLALSARCVPLDASPSPASSVQYVIVTQVVTSQAEVLETSTVVGSSSTASYSPSTMDASQQPSAVAPSSAFTPSPQTTTSVVTVVETVTPPPVTVTISEAPSTTTQTVTVTPTSSSTEAAKTAWAVPAQITDLSSFNVSEFAYGQHNMQIVYGIPAEASATTPTVLTVATAAIESVDRTPPPPILSPTWDNSSAVIQLLYPAGSINPESEPQGGADFYASPLDIKNATNVTMEYSVFFPQDFDWVLAGKLPGIYGGHTTCSGGDDATQCFSTRLMWREGGAGELYLVSEALGKRLITTNFKNVSVRAERQANRLIMLDTPNVRLRRRLWALDRTRGVQLYSWCMDTCPTKCRLEYPGTTRRKLYSQRRWSRGYETHRCVLSRRTSSNSSA